MYCGQALESANNGPPECFHLLKQNVFEKKNSLKLQGNKERQTFSSLHHYYTYISNKKLLFIYCFLQ